MGKLLYPWPALAIGETIEITTDKAIPSVRCASVMWARNKRNRNDDGTRKKFRISLICYTSDEGTENLKHGHYRVERIA